MSSFPRSPRVMKGALIGLDPYNPLASLIIFQYNPERLSRTLNARFSGANSSGAGPDAPGTGSARPVRIVGPPRETISVEIAIDATDQLEKASGPVTSMGIYPQLSALEMLLYPKSALVIGNAILSQVGLVEIHKPEAPLTLFVWGVKRVLPVRVTQFSVTETMYDPSLNPLHATVQLGLTVLNYDDLGLLSVGGGIFMAHQVVKEVMATISGIGSAASLLGGSS